MTEQPVLSGEISQHRLFYLSLIKQVGYSDSTCQNKHELRAGMFF
jgi:hypothetical protein